MSTADPVAQAVLKLFAEARDHRLSATSLKTKLAAAAKKSGEASADAEQVDRAIATLIDDGKVALTGGGKVGHHPRPKGSYRLTGSGKDHVKPGKPDVSKDLLISQEGYLLIQFFRIKEGGSSMSRSDLNGKLKTKAAKEKLELDPADNRDTIEYHLHHLVAAGRLTEERKGVSTIYGLTDEGRRALGSATYYDDIQFTLTGAALNELLAAARGPSTESRGEIAHQEDHHGARSPAHHAPAQHSAAIEPRQIHDYVAQLKADRFAGRDLIPIHEVRALVARQHGDEAASHPVFDRLLKGMRAEGDLKIIAIADSRETPQEHLDASIPGMNETLFFIDVE